MSGRRRSERKGLGGLIRQWVKRRRCEPQVDDSLLRLKWSSFVGERIGAHTRPRELKDGVLTVIVGDSAWLNELSFLRRELITKVNEGLGRRVVREIRLLSGPLERAFQDQEGKQVAARRRQDVAPPDETAIQRAAEELPEVTDPELGRAIARARAAQRRDED